MFVELFLLLITLIIVWTIADNYFSSRKLPPGPLRLPFIGNAINLFYARYQFKPPFVFFRDLSKKYGPISYIRMGARPAMIIDDFETSKQLLNNETWIDRPFPSFVAERSYGKPLGIIFVGGDGWREMRRFSMRTLRDFGYGKHTSMQSTLEDEVNKLLHLLDKVATRPEPILKMSHLFTMPVLNNLWSMVSSIRTPEDDAKLKKLVMLVDNLAKSRPIGGSILALFPWLRHIAPGPTGATFIRKCNTELQTYFSEILESRRAGDGVQNEDKRDFIDMFIKEIYKHEKLGSNPNHYTDEQFITTITDLFEAGSETSSNTLEFAFKYISKNVHVQKKVQDEIDRVVGRNRLPTLTDRANMPYTEATLLEVQRMANVLPMTVRCPTEVCTLDGFYVEEKTMAIVNIYSIHMDDSFWGDPWTFRPERFLDAKNQIIMQKASHVIPFGGGKRVCLGEQMAKATMFTYFVALLQAYTFKEFPRNNAKLGKCEDPESTLFQKDVHVGFTLSPIPYETLISKR